MFTSLAILCAVAVPVPAVESPLPWIPDSTAAVGTHFFTQDAARMRALESRRQLLAPGLTLPGGPTVDLELTRLDFHAERFHVHVDGAYRGIADGHGLTLWVGQVSGDDTSDVFLGLSPVGSYGWIRTAGQVYHVASFVPPGGTWSDPMVRVYSEQVEAVARAFNLSSASEFCAIDQLPPMGPSPSGPGNGYQGDGTCALRECPIAVETDWQYYSLFNNLPAAQVFTYCLLTSISHRFEEQADVVLTYPYLQFYTTSSDPWSTPDTGNGGTLGMLYEFQSAWTSDPPCLGLPTGVTPQGGSIPGGAHLAHFISGASLGGGIAYLPVVCNAATCYGFGVSADMGGAVSYTFPSAPTGGGSLNWDFVVVAHELGHNFHACHTHQTCVGGSPIDRCYVDTIDCGDNPGACSAPPQACINTGTIMSYCHLCNGGLNNITTYFHPYHADVIRNAASCLPCFNGVGTTLCLGMPNSTTVGAVLTASGSSSLASNSMQLNCSNLPTAGGGTTAMIVNSRGPVANTTFPASGGVTSDGYLCLGTSTNGATFGRHFQDIYQGSAGSFSRSVNLQAIPHPPFPPYAVAAQVGQTWYFQVWYRDVGPPAGRSNFSSAVSVTITP